MKVSVIMSIYKEPIDWIKKSISSILNQTFKEFELIIINDNPERIENTQLLQEVKNLDSRVIVITNEKNLGLIESLNKGLKIAKGKYIARMDADDFSVENRLELQYNFMEENPSYIVCGSRIKYFGNKRKFSSSSWIKTDTNKVKIELIRNSCFAHPTVMIRKSILDKNKIIYNKNYIHAEDYKFWADLVKYGDFYNFEEPLLHYRVSSQQVTNKNRIAQANTAKKIRREYISNYLPKKTMSLVYKEKIDLKLLKKIKIELKKQKVPKLIFQNILFVTYLSIKKSGVILLLYYFFSFDFIKSSSQVTDLFRVLENCLFPLRKQSRI